MKNGQVRLAVFETGFSVLLKDFLRLYNGDLHFYYFLVQFPKDSILSAGISWSLY